ncbi:MAG TPA: hypothetical protein ENN69_01195, partial [Spirochaetia bacterium]|nr:hypothetical protein [Spirochaetia bacterium]
WLDIAGKGVIVTRTLVRLGEQAVHLTHLGGPFRDFFKLGARKERIKLTIIPARAGIRFCVTLLDATQARTTEIVPEGDEISPEVEKRFRRAFIRLLPRARCVIISGSKAPGYADSFYPDLVRAATAAGRCTVIDFRGPDLAAALPAGPAIVTPNRTEFMQTFFPDDDPTSRTPETNTLLANKLRELSSSVRSAFVLTDGDREIIIGAAGKVTTLTPGTVQAVNTTGCGDVFTAALAAAVMKKQDLSDAVIFAERQARAAALSPRPGFVLPERY